MCLLGAHLVRACFAPIAAAALLGSSGCAGETAETAPETAEPVDSVYDGPPVPWQVTPFPRVVEPEDNPSTDEKIELGRLLFYDPVLSRDGAVACATCHSEIWGLTDGLDVSIGVDGEGPTGPGRVGPNKTSRNALTLWNVAYRSALFWDGRSTSLEEQAVLPIREPKELGASETVEADLAAIDEYVGRFVVAFPDDPRPVSLDNVARALAAFQRTLVSSRAPYDQYVAGDAGAMSDASLRGMEQFARLGCATCHEPPLFASDRHARRIEGIDPGRSAVTGDAGDVGAFRVPTLRNARETGPYFHDGSVVRLADAIQIEVAVEVAAGRAPSPTDGEVADLVAFVEKALVDRANDPSRPKAVPSGLDVPADGFRIPR